MHVPVHKPNTGINPHEEAPKWIWKFATVVRKGPVIKASLCEEAEGAHAESSCSAAIPGTVCMLKLAQNTELNYHHRQVALLLLLLLLHRASQTKAKTKEVG